MINLESVNNTIKSINISFFLFIILILLIVISIKDLKKSENDKNKEIANDIDIYNTSTSKEQIVKKARDLREYISKYPNVKTEEEANKFLNGIYSILFESQPVIKKDDDLRALFTAYKQVPNNKTRISFTKSVRWTIVNNRIQDKVLSNHKLTKKILEILPEFIWG